MNRTTLGNLEDMLTLYGIKEPRIISELLLHGGFEPALHTRGINSFTHSTSNPDNPTQEEILTLWWKTSIRGVVSWVKVIAYISSSREPYRLSHKLFDNNDMVNREWFSGRFSAVIPEEE